MAKKYYAVVEGREGSGIYLDWDTTEKNVKGISGVKFKSFPDKDSAVKFIVDKGIDRAAIVFFQKEEIAGEGAMGASPGKSTGSSAGKTARSSGKRPVKALTNGPWDVGEATHTAAWSRAAKRDPLHKSGIMTAYVDGSFRQGYSVYGYGVVIVSEGEVLKTLSGYGSREEYVSMRNVAGEVLGAVKAMEFAMAEGITELILHFDYQGIESWAKGTWKRNNDLTRGYYEFVRKNQQSLRITFRKVKGHSGDRFNDLADQLAKEAVESSRLK